MVTRYEAVNVRILRVWCEYAGVTNCQNGTLLRDESEDCIVCEVRPLPDLP